MWIQHSLLARQGGVGQVQLRLRHTLLLVENGLILKDEVVEILLQQLVGEVDAQPE